MGLFSWDVFEYIRTRMISDSCSTPPGANGTGWIQWNRHGSSLVATIHLWLAALRKQHLCSTGWCVPGFIGNKKWKHIKLPDQGWPIEKDYEPLPTSQPWWSSLPTELAQEEYHQIHKHFPRKTPHTSTYHMCVNTQLLNQTSISNMSNYHKLSSTILQNHHFSTFISDFTSTSSIPSSSNQCPRHKRGLQLTTYTFGSWLQSFCCSLAMKTHLKAVPKRPEAWRTRVVWTRGNQEANIGDVYRGEHCRHKFKPSQMWIKHD